MLSIAEKLKSGEAKEMVGVWARSARKREEGQRQASGQETDIGESPAKADAKENGSEYVFEKTTTDAQRTRNSITAGGLRVAWTKRTCADDADRNARVSNKCALNEGRMADEPVDPQRNVETQEGDEDDASRIVRSHVRGSSASGLHC